MGLIKIGQLSIKSIRWSI